MKKIFLMAVAFICIGQFTYSQTITETPEVKLIRAYYEQVDMDTKKDKKVLQKFIAPSYLRSVYSKQPIPEALVYTDFFYKIAKQDGGLIYVYIWGYDNKSWVHEIIFEVRKEAGKFYIFPSTPKNEIRSIYNCFYKKNDWIKTDKEALVDEHPPALNFRRGKPWANNQSITKNGSNSKQQSQANISKFADAVVQEFANSGYDLVYQKRNTVLHHDNNSRLSRLKYNTKYQIIFLCQDDQDRTLTIKCIDDGNSNDFSPQEIDNIKGIQCFSVVLDTKQRLKYDVSISPAVRGNLLVFDRKSNYDHSSKNRNKGLLELMNTIK